MFRGKKEKDDIEKENESKNIKCMLRYNSRFSGNYDTKLI